MGKVLLDVDLTSDEVANITAFLHSLTGEVPEKYKKAPEALSMKYFFTLLFGLPSGYYMQFPFLHKGLIQLFQIHFLRWCSE